MKHPTPRTVPIKRVLEMQAAVIDKQDVAIGKLESKLVDAEFQLERAVGRINELLPFETSYRNLLCDKVNQAVHLIEDRRGIAIIKVNDQAAMHHATVPSITNRLNNVCKNLDAIVVLKVDDLGDISIVTTDDREAADRYGVVAIPKRSAWLADPDKCMKRVQELFLEFAPKR